jgi:hypothetical protein
VKKTRSIRAEKILAAGAPRFAPETRDDILAKRGGGMIVP